MDYYKTHKAYNLLYMDRKCSDLCHILPSRIYGMHVSICTSVSFSQRTHTTSICNQTYMDLREMKWAMKDITKWRTLWLKLLTWHCSSNHITRDDRLYTDLRWGETKTCIKNFGGMVLKLSQFKDHGNGKIMLKWLLGRCVDVDWMTAVLTIWTIWVVLPENGYSQ